MKDEYTIINRPRVIALTYIENAIKPLNDDTIKKFCQGLDLTALIELAYHLDADVVIEDTKEKIIDEILTSLRKDNE